MFMTIVLHTIDYAEPEYRLVADELTRRHLPFRTELDVTCHEPKLVVVCPQADEQHVAFGQGSYLLEFFDQIDVSVEALPEAS